MVSIIQRGMLVLAFAMFSWACLPGDRSVHVSFVNDSTAPLAVFPYGRNYPDSQFTLAPAERVTKNLLAGEAQPDSPVAHVEALSTDRALVFCHDYTYGELQKLDRTVRLRPGVLDCR